MLQPSLAKWVRYGDPGQPQSASHIPPAGWIRRGLGQPSFSRRACPQCPPDGDERPAPPDGLPVPVQWNPDGSSCLRQLAWREGPGSTSLCNRRPLIESSSRRGRPQATLSALEASCLPCLCDGRSYRRAHTRRIPNGGERAAFSRLGGRPLKQPCGPLLSQHLPSTVQEALVASHLGRGGYPG